MILKLVFKNAHFRGTNFDKLKKLANKLTILKRSILNCGECLEFLSDKDVHFLKYLDKMNKIPRVPPVLSE